MAHELHCTPKALLVSSRVQTESRECVWLDVQGEVEGQVWISSQLGVESFILFAGSMVDQQMVELFSAEQLTTRPQTNKQKAKGFFSLAGSGLSEGL